MWKARAKEPGFKAGYEAEVALIEDVKLKDALVGVLLLCLSS